MAANKVMQEEKTLELMKVKLLAAVEDSRRAVAVRKSLQMSESSKHALETAWASFHEAFVVYCVKEKCAEGD